MSGQFAFGENWASYAGTVTEESIAAAADGLIRLLGADGLKGRRLIDVGCGSGIHALAAIRLGAAEVVAVDPVSVRTARKLLEAQASEAARVEEVSVFDLDPRSLGSFDIVYSWGVLHHSGDMARAIACAAALVKSGGLFAFALYRRSKLCRLWRIEKRWYSQASPRAQALVRSLYIAAFRLACLVTRRDFKAHVAAYRSRRGMSFVHDVHDWLGGYPYESITPAEVDRRMSALGFEPVRSFVGPSSFGLFGSGCDEYVYRRP